MSVTSEQAVLCVHLLTFLGLFRLLLPDFGRTPVREGAVSYIKDVRARPRDCSGVSPGRLALGVCYGDGTWPWFLSHLHACLLLSTNPFLIAEFAAP